MVTIHSGGAAFLIIYFLLVATLGLPLLVLELSLGQYSAFPPARLYRHLCPLLAGLGLAVTLQALIRAVLELAVLMWAGRGLFHLFFYQEITKELFSREILNSNNSSLTELGHLESQALLVLGIASLSTFICVVAGTRSVGKVSMLAVPTCFMLLVTLAIRTCLGRGGPQGVLHLLTPDWSVLTLPEVWLEAAAQVIFSLQLGLGSFTTFASYSKYEHNIVRDAVIMTVSHLVWVLLCILLTLCLLGLTMYDDSISPSPEDTVTNAGKDIWLAMDTLTQNSFIILSHGWLWAGLYFILIILVGLTSLFGFLEVVTSTMVSIQLSLVRYRPVLCFCVLALVFLVDMALATQGGIHIYHLLSTYISTWPTLLFSLLTVLATIICHGSSNLMKDLGDMSKLQLPHWVTSHLSVIYCSVLPILLTAALVRILYLLFLPSPSSSPLSLPTTWILPLTWTLCGLPILPILLGAVLHTVWIRRGVSLSQHVSSLLRPTDLYYRNEHLESVSSPPRNNNNRL